MRDQALPAVQRREALATLGTVSAPTSDAVAEARLAAHSTDADLRSTGALALGSQAHGLADDNTAASRSIVDELIAMLEGGDDNTGPDPRAAVAWQQPRSPPRAGCRRSARARGADGA